MQRFKIKRMGTIERESLEQRLSKFKKSELVDLACIKFGEVSELNKKLDNALSRLQKIEAEFNEASTNLADVNRCLETLLLQPMKSLMKKASVYVESEDGFMTVKLHFDGEEISEDTSYITSRSY